MSGLFQRVENEIRKRELFSRGQRMLVAVSGGVDSMVLLHVLNLLARKNRWKISVAHFNHQLRGRASAADARFVRAVSKRLRLPFHGGSADIKKFAITENLSLEMAARQLRHDFLARIARKQKLATVVLAHHADDQVELFFLRLLRGTGGEGLAGMKWHSPSPANNIGRAKLRLCSPVGCDDQQKNDTNRFGDMEERQLHPTGQKISLVRPLLGFSKVEILACARENKIRFREDVSNLSHDFLRNRIRNELLPLLREKYQPGLTKTVLRLMEIAGAEAELAGEIAQQATLVKDGKLADRSRAVQRKILQQQLHAAGITADFELVEQLRDSADTFVSVGTEISVARDVTGCLTVRRQTSLPGFKPDEFKVKLSGRAGRVSFGGRQFSWAFKKHVGSPVRPAQPAMEFFDADKIGSGIVLRYWRPGDRFWPIGLRSATKLQDLFVNAKIPASQRRSLVLATTAGGEVFWVEGLRIGESFKLTSATKRQLIWKWSNLAV